MEDYKIIGQNIMRIRDKLGFRQDDLADLLQVSRPMICHYEKGEREISLDQLEKLANVFGIDLLDLLNSDSNQCQINYAFAFKASELTTVDLNSIADFQNVVKSYLKMKRIANDKV
jgi:transcriptional regulator with XRE-family HTH domain